jgi:predicted  nucleic acid-binding Zn-ribbon protein
MPVCKTEPVNDRALSELRGLARLDAELAARAADLRERDVDINELRACAETIDAFFAAYAGNEATRQAAVAAAVEELARRRDELARAEAALAAARNEDARSHAQHTVDRARDHIAVAEASVLRAEADAAELEREAAALPGELAELERRSGTSLTGARALVDWASKTHAELFVAAGQIDARRERVIREAHELASMLLGEQTFGASVAQALARVERHWESLPGQVSESK